MLACCHGCSDRLAHLSFAFSSIANANFCIFMISAHLTNAQATRIKIKIKPSCTQRVRALVSCPKTPIPYDYVCQFT